MMNMTINALPAFTYRWLHMNQTKLEHVSAVHSVPVTEEIPASVKKLSAVPDEVLSVETGAGPDMDRLLEASGGHFRVYQAESGSSQALRLRLRYDESAEGGAADGFALILPEGSEMTVVQDITSEKSFSGFGALQTKILAGPHAHLNLIQVIRPENTLSLINDIGAVCGEEAGIDVIQLFLGGKEVYQGLRTDLRGKGSGLTVNAGYQLDGNRLLDMNYVAVQSGKKTSSSMKLSGVLREEARKLFRGTIDFPKGCAGSVGDEMEDVLMLDDTVVNQTIPLILCAEEDVSGNHGATIGRLDENILYYAESRGMKPEEIYEMMSKARIDHLVRMIPDGQTRHDLYVLLKEDDE